MSYTPVELRHVRVGRRPLGYHRAAVEEVLSDVADSFEIVWRDRGELSDRVEALEQALEEARQREQLLTNTLVAAEHAAEEMRERARREADLIVAEAHAEARAVLHAGQGERERLLGEVRRIEALLRSALEVVGEAHAAGEQPAEPEPKREEPRDLRPIATPVPPAPEAPRELEPPQPTAQQELTVADDDTPGWPPLRKVAQGGADFDWGD
jgi:cell division initiation protein